MKPIPGMPPPALNELVRAQDRISFVYLERCVVHRDANAITATDERGTIHLPAASIGALLLGPGTNVSHQAMMLLAESGSTAVWVGERGVRYYAHGRSLARSSRLLEAQAAQVSNKQARLRVARAMYEMRFPGEDISHLTMQQLRGREGARVKRIYRDQAERVGVEWNRRSYDPDNFNDSDLVNQALSAATTCLYGIVHAVVVALGCSPGLGFVHTGHVRSFVFDIADLYKAEVAVPVAFEVAAQQPEDLPAETRRAVRDAVHDGSILRRCVKDIQSLLLPDEDDDSMEWGFEDADVISLWDGGGRVVAGGRSYDDGDEPW
jgi:CRISP-associated protein Cas1